MTSAALALARIYRSDSLAAETTEQVVELVSHR